MYEEFWLKFLSSAQTSLVMCVTNVCVCVCVSVLTTLNQEYAEVLNLQLVYKLQQNGVLLNMSRYVRYTLGIWSISTCR